MLHKIAKQKLLSFLNFSVVRVNFPYTKRKN